MHKSKVRLLFLILLGLLTLSHSVALAQKSATWNSFNVTLELLPSGNVNVTEEQTISLTGGTFTYGYATILRRNLDNITNIRVSEGSQVFRQSSSEEPYTFTVSDESDKTTINWFFPQTQGEHTYTFQYTVEGMVRVEPTGKQLFWMAIPTDMAGYVESSQVTIRMPEGSSAESTTALVNGQELSDMVTRISDDKRTITFSPPRGFSPGETFEVGVRFPADQLPSLTVPAWQRREQSADTYNFFFLLSGIAIAILGPLGVVLLWYSKGRDPKVEKSADYLAELPNDLPPGVVGALIDEKADMKDIIATLIDLARRGYLTMTEEKKDHLFTRTDKPITELRNYESALLTHLFNKRDARRLSDLREKFYVYVTGLQYQIYQQLVAEKMFNASPDAVRGRYTILGIIALVVGGGLTALIANQSWFQLYGMALCPALALLPTGLLMAIVAQYMPRKTAKGAEETMKWIAFRNYLKEIEKYTNLQEATDIFEKYLPYAIAFGLERSWIKKFARIETTPIPTWYGPIYARPYYGGQRGGSISIPGSQPSGGGGMPSLEGMSGGLSGGLQNMSDGLTRMLNSTASTMQSQPQSKSSSGGGGFGGGFSGGSSGGGGRGFG